MNLMMKLGDFIRLHVRGPHATKTNAAIVPYSLTFELSHQLSSAAAVLQKMIAHLRECVRSQDARHGFCGPRQGGVNAVSMKDAIAL